MNILYPNWKSFGVNDIKEAFEKNNYTVILYNKEPKNYRIDPKYKSELKHYIKDYNIEAVFTSNYFPVISDACNELNIPYISWCYDCPLVLTYSKTILNSCNYVFVFDSQMMYDIQALGAKNVYYLPMAVNAERLAKISASPQQKKIVEADISFVGSMYTEKHTLYERINKLDEHTRGYLEGIMAAQQNIYGYSFIEQMLTPEIIDKLMAAVPVQINENDFETLNYIYANYFLYRKITQMDRIETLTYLSYMLTNVKTTSGKSIPPIKLYTPEATPLLPKVKNMGPVEYNTEMPIVFQNSKINLNITLRSIKNGIPLRAIDIMGAGGFLLTNWQNDFNLHFIDGKDFVSFSSKEDLYEKILYYLEHEDERNAIAYNGCQKVRKEHTYDLRIKEIINNSPLKNH